MIKIIFTIDFHNKEELANQLDHSANLIMRGLRDGVGWKIEGFEEKERNEDFSEDKKSQLIEDNLEKLQAYFIETNEYKGQTIIKDNCEDLFDQWSEEQSLEEIKEILK